MNITHCPICASQNLIAGTSTFKQHYRHEKEVVHVYIACSDCGSQISLKKYSGDTTKMQDITALLWDNFNVLKVN